MTKLEATFRNEIHASNLRHQYMVMLCLYAPPRLIWISKYRNSYGIVFRANEGHTGNHDISRPTRGCLALV